MCLLCESKFNKKKKKKKKREIIGQYLWWLIMCGCACENFYNQIKFDIF